MANLVLNGRSIDSIDDIAENFVEDDVLREFKSGSLVAWLEEYGYDEEFMRVREIKPTASSTRILSAIIDVLNLDDEVIARANARREEQQRKDGAIRKVHEEQHELPDIKAVLNFREKKVLEIFLDKAEQGVAKARLALGLYYSYKYSIAYDRTKALDKREKGHYWLVKAAEQGDAEAQNHLGLQYLGGPGNVVVQDYCEAAKWFRKAAEQGYVYGQVNIGECYRDGVGVAVDYDEARKWYHKAAEQGYAPAQQALDAIGNSQDTTKGC